MFGRRVFGGFGIGASVGRPAVQPRAPFGADQPPSAYSTPASGVPMLPSSTVPAADCDVSPAGSTTRLVDTLYSDLPSGEVSYLFREARARFLPIARAEDGTGTILSLQVGSAQTLLISDVEFYAQAPNPLLPGDQLAIEARQLAGYLTLHLLVDDRAPFDLYAELDAPVGTASPQSVQGSVFNSLGKVIGGAERQPHLFIRAREGQTVRLGYSVVNAPAIPVAHVGAMLRGYVVPTAIFASKTTS